ncbi:MAG: Ig-like domain-containing protein, partial [Gammaproteobacteria bacterium]
LATPGAAAQVLAVDDDFGVAPNEPLEVDAPGVLDNDLVDGEAAAESGATVTLVSDVATGTLALAADGSFTFTAGSDFSGVETFVYELSSGGETATAAVTLSACKGGPRYFTCWKENAFIARADELGFVDRFAEGFEDDVAWGAARSPQQQPSVVSQGIRWQSNHRDPPASNLITTGPGPARSGQWAVFDQEHGYAENLDATACDVDEPPPECLWHDGFTGIREPGLAPLNGVGGYISGTHSGAIAIVLDDAVELRVGPTTHAQHVFFGAIDADPAGFGRFEFRELDGKSGQLIFVFGDDFTILGTPPPPAPPTATHAAVPIPVGAVALLGLAVALTGIRRTGTRRSA